MRLARGCQRFCTVGLALFALVAASSCSGSYVGDDDRVVVFAAASLGDAFADLATSFETEYPELQVELNLGGSSSLREQILAGAPADVFASADQSNMRALSGSGELARVAEPLASNTMQLAIASTSSVEGLADLANPDLLVGLCAPTVPCGELAQALLGSAGVTPSVDTFEPDVRSLTTKIGLGELDAGIVYVTDVRNAGESVVGIEIDTAQNVTTEYPIALLTRSPNPTGAATFIAFARSEQGQAILADHGFGPP